MNCIAPGCKAARELGALFCAVHMAAPAGRRGGWISAEKRRRQLAASKETSLDASNIVKRLWIGGQPPLDRDLPDFDVLVLCAREIQPGRPALGFRKQLIRVPLPDSALDDNELHTALVGSKHVAKAFATGHRVLVTCAQGRNRSALVAGLALGITSRLTADQIVELIRKRRSETALSNPHFVGYLEHYVGAIRRVRARTTG